MSGRAPYAAILRAPHVAPLLVASMLARLPFGMFTLALVLYLAHERDSFAVAGLVDGAFGIARDGDDRRLRDRNRGRRVARRGRGLARVLRRRRESPARWPR